MNSPIRLMCHADQRAGLFFVAVVLDVALGRLIRVVRGLSLVTLSNLRVVCCFFVVPCFVVLGGLLMMFLRVARMFGRARMMLCCLLCHLNLLYIVANEMKLAETQLFRDGLPSFCILSPIQSSLNTAKLVIPRVKMVSFT
jgi:hypothetical protein